MTERDLASGFSLVLPALNEAGNIGALVREADATVPREHLIEIIVVDDGSSDATPEEVRALLGQVPGLRYIRHRVPRGQSAAVRTGVRAAATRLVATMDGDGQNDPRDLMRLVSGLTGPGPAVPTLVGGVRTSRKADSSKRLASRFANWLRDAILDDGCPDTGCGIKAFRRDAFLDLPFFSGMHRYLPALFQTYGHAVAYVPVNDRPRLAGQSKYTNLGRALLGVYDLVGVRWLRRRTTLPEITETLGGAAAPLPSGPDAATAPPLAATGASLGRDSSA